MAKPSNYWDKRAIKRLTDAEKQSEAYIKRIQKMYDQANRNIQRDIENIYANYSKATGLDVQSLKTILTKTETAKLWDELRAKGLDQYVKGNYKARITRLEKLQAQIYAKAKELYPQEQKAHTDCYKGVINDSYYKAIYDTQMGTGFDFAFSNLDDNMVTGLLNERWSGKNYSQRIWGNTDILAESLSEVIGGAMLSGQSIQKTARQIRERFDVGKYYAERLVRTETNHFNNEADAMAYEEMDVEKYVFLATLDTRTSTICQNLDNEVFELKERQVGVNYPPMHPNCRSKTRAYMGEEIEKTLKRRARNPITNKTEIVGNISYEEWAKKHGIDKPQTPKPTTPKAVKQPIIDTNEPTKITKKVETVGKSGYNTNSEPDIHDLSQYKYVTDEEVSDWKKHAGKCTQDEYKQINKHDKPDGSKGGYVRSHRAWEFNAELREGKERLLDADDKKTLETIRKLCKDNTTDRPVVLNRFVESDYLTEYNGVFNKMRGDLVDEALEFVNGNMIGTEKTEKAIVSASYGANVLTDRAVRIRLHCPKGTHMFVTRNKRESEVLFHDGLTYEIVSASKETYKHPILRTDRFRLVLDVVVKNNGL